MLTEERILETNAELAWDSDTVLSEGILSEVLGFETDEVVRSAEGSGVLTYRGETFIDFTGGIAVHACGHNHPEIVAAIQRQAEDCIHVSDIMRHTPQLELGRWMRARLDTLLTPGSPWQFLFKNSGSESVDAAAKLALKATGRTQFIAFDGAFHGRTLFATALSHSKTLHWDAYEGFLGPLRANIHHAPAPRCAGCNLSRRENCCANGLEALLARVGPENVAAVFLEAEQGEGGYVPMAPAAAQKIRALTKQHGILLIADEIQSGWGRTGRWFGFEHLGIEPDIIVFGKAVGGGLPLAGVAARQETMQKWQPGEHGTTFGGNPIACAAGLAALKIIDREGLVERVAELGERIKTRLSRMIGHYGIVDVRGHGLMLGLELRDAEGNPDYARVESVKKKARRQGLLMLSCGAKIGSPTADNSTLRLIPALNISEATLESGLSILEVALQDNQ